ncbi:hypothetical protein SERLA73DRAFT_120042 [Serpula lacrymans var. lacrymans S7.3]|uniref:NAD(P)-binding protein n=2 Tax=Serpula lacrymans var. lacrymans TaxID=341189 RepID=F8PN70_SERL3|nr:uncharacterized protein SERLADRAFT_366489 [Serpula lacrymans var. lacrymans S7.9]EGO03052.1 hypothetical protein SERLA73DRAFT_120042 [Serpula lacrymans var. lacrymans S7.3]EGO28792.1 hypothetical protein SERLADRAFT_366489 [Serpula lacrymans var. lacrymans S7.9]
MVSSSSNGSIETAREKIWLITGTSSGFGRRLVDIALARGDRVIATARSLDAIKDFPQSDKVRLLRLDVTDDCDHIKTVVDEAVATWGHIDVIVNNAGMGINGLIEEAGSKVFRRVFDTNFFGLIDVTNAVLPHMRARKSGVVVLIGSRSSWMPENMVGALYCASKAAVRAFGETLSAEVEQFGIRVLIVEPGAFRTEGILSYPFYEEHSISSYDDSRNRSKGRLGAIQGKQKGDPVKAMEVLVDVVKGEGIAAGKVWPLYLPLGSDADEAIRTKCDKMVGVLDEWTDLVGDLNFDDSNVKALG